jgi:hypothetical protein
MYSLEFDKKQIVPNNQEIKSFTWNYPSNVIINFFNQQETEPYATIVGPKSMRYAEEFCQFVPTFSKEFQVSVKEETKSIFPFPDSYFIVSGLE